MVQPWVLFCYLDLFRQKKKHKKTHTHIFKNHLKQNVAKFTFLALLCGKRYINHAAKVKEIMCNTSIIRKDCIPSLLK
jgi:hypothetical protein